jgi:hypothetical protein
MNWPLKTANEFRNTKEKLTEKCRNPARSVNFEIVLLGGDNNNWRREGCLLGFAGSLFAAGFSASQSR